MMYLVYSPVIDSYRILLPREHKLETQSEIGGRNRVGRWNERGGHLPVKEQLQIHFRTEHIIGRETDRDHFIAARGLCDVFIYFFKDTALFSVS